MNSEKLEVEQQKMRHRHQPYSLKGTAGDARKKQKRRIIAHCLLQNTPITALDIVNLPVLFKGATLKDLQSWVDRGMPLTD